MLLFRHFPAGKEERHEYPDVSSMLAAVRNEHMSRAALELS
jgi:hypothetical protein